MTKVVARHVWEDAKERINAHRLTERGKRLYARRKETVERSFADAKELHGHRYARFRGRHKVLAQCLLAAAAQNMKKIARLLVRFLSVYCSHNALSGAVRALFCSIELRTRPLIASFVL